METVEAIKDPLSLVFAALADPTRRAILTRLARRHDGAYTVSEIAEEFLDRMSLPAVTKHLKVLERAKLIQKTREAQFRPCQIDAEPLREAAAWLEPYRRMWEERFDRLEAYLARTAPAESEAANTPPPKKKRKPRANKPRVTQRARRKSS
jgi:DNA-binding transcriptional ArsR family regulator